MKTKEEILEARIKEYNLRVNDISKFKLDKEERNLFCDAMDEYASQFQPEWIPVEVRLPEENIPVLCTNVNGVEDVELLTIGLRYKDSTSFYLTEINQLTDQVTHWMPFPPLPQPYNPTKS